MRRSRVLALIFVVMVFPTATVWAQQTLYGCVKNNNGQIRMVAAGETCLPSEHPIQWAAAGSGVAAMPPPAAPGPLRVLDQNSVPIGLFASQSLAARQIGTVWVGLPVNAAGFQVSDVSSFRPSYQSTDCTGDAYTSVDMTNMLRTGLVMNDAATGHLTFSYAGTPEVDRTTIHSYAWLTGGTWVCYTYTPGTWMPLFGKVTTVDLSAFVAPFKFVQ